MDNKYDQHFLKLGHHDCEIKNVTNSNLICICTFCLANINQSNFFHYSNTPHFGVLLKYMRENRNYLSREMPILWINTLQKMDVML